MEDDYDASTENDKCMKPPVCPKEQYYDEERGECEAEGLVGIKEVPHSSVKLIASVNQTEKINTDVGGEKIPFQYLVVFKNEVSDNAGLSDGTLTALIDLVEVTGAEVFYKYENAIKGFAFKAPNQQILSSSNSS